ncbi:MAG: membrane protein insertion efficiency factor YidD [bacterium]
MIRLLVFLIKVYQRLISPFLGRNCRFYPSCSNYALQALKKYKTKGIFLAVKRLFSCHPFNKGGINLPIILSSFVGCFLM